MNDYQTLRILILLSFAVVLSSCAMMDKIFDNKEAAAAPNPAAPADTGTEARKDAPLVKYSENSNMAPPTDRNYRAMTRARMEEESELNAQAGSMWMMEGQTSYLFTQNKIRREGDSMNLKLEGAGMKQVENKVSIIRSLLKKLEAQQKAAEEAAKAAKLAEQEKAETADRAPASATDKPVEKKLAAVEPAKEEKEEKIDLKEVESIPTRITERMSDGSYRVRGSQTMMIGKREYRVIATGVVRQEDFNDNGVSSSKLLEPQFDVILVKRMKNEVTN